MQGLPSSHTGATPPTQTPVVQTSAVVQALASLQGDVLLTCKQPATLSQESVVQGLLSLQFGATPPTQLPLPSQVSAVVQLLPSLQPAVLNT